MMLWTSELHVEARGLVKLYTFPYLFIWNVPTSSTVRSLSEQPPVVPLHVLRRQ